VQSIKGNAETFTIEKTGETKTISGVLCEKALAKTGSGVTEMWLTKDFGADFFKYAAFFKSSSELQALGQARIKGVPVSSSTTDNSGANISTYELISLVSKDIPDSEFTVPAEYKAAEEIKKK